MARIGISVLFLASLCLNVVSNHAEGADKMNTTDHAAVEKISARETKGLLVNDFAVLVDVREEDEVKDGMAADAQWMPMSKIEADDPAWVAFQKKLPKDKKIVLYCAVGGRAGRVAKMLSEKGFKTANMGGFASWVAAGLPVKKP